VGVVSLVKKYPLVLPIPKEQQKIASCLSSLDALIEAQNKKVSALKQPLLHLLNLWL
jgi:type I restriction enzyme S subunit